MLTQNGTPITLNDTMDIIVNCTVQTKLDVGSSVQVHEDGMFTWDQSTENRK